MRDIGVPISIMLGFAILAAAIQTKDTDFESCVRLTREVTPDDFQGDRRELAIVTMCQPN